MTKFTDNSQPITTSTDVIEWLQTKLGSKTPISLTMNRDGTIKNLELEKKLSKNDIEKIKKKFPELE